MIQLGENRYGKSRVRLMRVKRSADGHWLYEWTVQVLLRGDFESCFRDGDNSRILPTDTMKNTVYSLARKSQAATMEEFAQEMVEFLLARNPQVTEAEVGISAKLWERLVTAGAPHPTAFVQAGGERQTTRVSRAQGGEFRVESGLENLMIMKTAHSGFEGYIKDSLTTLPPTSDRLLGTALKATWVYAVRSSVSPRIDFEYERSRIRETLLVAFAEHDSKSVQHTLHFMAEGALATSSEIDEIELTMPNIHCLPVDLSRFGQDNPNEIFVPIDEPHGYIEARLRRE
jgi:urate oxidase